MSFTLTCLLLMNSADDQDEKIVKLCMPGKVRVHCNASVFKGG